MRLYGIVLLVAVMMAMSGDHHRTPLPIFSDGVCLASHGTLPPGMQAAASFWFRRTGAERTGMSTDADARISAAYTRIAERAHQIGLKVEPPLLRVTKPELALLLGPGIRYVFAMHYSGPRIILLNGWWLERLDEQDLEYLLAHELGHAIDSQNERRGHRFLDLFSDTDDADLVADILSMMLVSPRSVFRFSERHEAHAMTQER